MFESSGNSERHFLQSFFPEVTGRDRNWAFLAKLWRIFDLHMTHCVTDRVSKFVNFGLELNRFFFLLLTVA